MNKARMKEFRQLATTLRSYKVPLYERDFETSVQSGSDLIKENPKAKDGKGKLLKPDQKYNVRKPVMREIDFVEKFKYAYKKGGMPAVQGAYNYMQMMIQQHLNNQAIKETTAELSQPAEA